MTFTYILRSFFHVAKLDFYFFDDVWAKEPRVSKFFFVVCQKAVYLNIPIVQRVPIFLIDRILGSLR